MNGHDAFQIYNAVRLHFTTDKFDYFTYNGKTRITAESFNARKDKYTFHKVARVIKEDDMPYFFAVNFMKGDGKSWISSMLQEDASKNFKEWQHWQENRLINLEKDLKKLKGKFEKLIICKNGQFPEKRSMRLFGHYTLILFLRELSENRYSRAITNYPN